MPQVGKAVADEEVVGLVREVVLICLEVWILNNGQRQLHGLWNDLTFKCGNRRLDGNCNLGRTSTSR